MPSKGRVRYRERFSLGVESWEETCMYYRRSVCGLLKVRVRSCWVSKDLAGAGLRDITV